MRETEVLVVRAQREIVSGGIEAQPVATRGRHLLRRPADEGERRGSGPFRQLSSRCSCRHDPICGILSVSTPSRGTEMDPQQIALVKASFAQATREPRALARVFYERLFATSPELQDLFTRDPREQQVKLTDELRVIVDLLDHVDELVVRTSDLGMRHVEYGARADHYDLVGVALIDAFKEVLGSEMTPEVERAWRYAYNLVAEAMQQGAAASTTSRRGGG
jgi:hemoglobin-like flavoprotein